MPVSSRSGRNEAVLIALLFVGGLGYILPWAAAASSACVVPMHVGVNPKDPLIQPKSPVAVLFSYLVIQSRKDLNSNGN